MTTKKYRNATVKLWIGAILLALSWMYLGDHPAEKASLLSGVEVLQYRATMALTAFQGEDTDALEQQYKIKRYIEEMRYTAQHTSGCEEGALLGMIDEAADKVRQSEAVVVAESASHYWNAIREWEWYIQNHCASISTQK